MFLFRKNIILVPTDYDGVSLTKGLLSFDCYDNVTKCTLHCYNLYEEGPLTLGVAIGSDLRKIEIRGKDAKNVQFEIDRAIKNRDEISCVLLDVKQKSYDILLWGSTQISSGWKTSLQMMLQDEILPQPKVQKSFETEKSFQDVEYENKVCEQQYENDFQYDQKSAFDEKELLTDMQTTHMEKMQSTEDEIYTYDDEKMNEFIDKVIDMTEDKNFGEIKNEDTDKMSFFERINPQIEKLFALNKEETVLNEIIPNSKFCKINFDDGTGYYVFGIIYEDRKPKYLCYGIPAQKNSEPPKELSNLYQWLPLDTEEENGDGFYMMYQDASTGKNISVEVV